MMVILNVFVSYEYFFFFFFFFFSSRRRHTRWNCDWSSDVCSSDLTGAEEHVRKAWGIVAQEDRLDARRADRKSTRLNSSHSSISYAVFCLKKKKKPSATAPRPTLTAAASALRNCVASPLRHSLQHA